MRRTNLFRIRWQAAACWVAMLGVAATAGPLWGQAPAGGNKLTEPVHRVARVNDPVATAEHPLDKALELARNGLANIRANVRDYTCILVKRERIGGELRDYEYMEAKIRNEHAVNGQIVTPFSVYMKFLKPAEVQGREVIYVRGRNEEKMRAHEGGNGVWSRFPSVWLNPTGPIAMKDNRYPITEIGIETLIIRLIEKGVRDRARGECEVEFRENARINGRKCTMLQVTHPHPRPYFDFHIAQIFIDDEMNVPIRYAAFTWSETPGGEPVPQEEYTYLRMKLNVGLTDEDFNPENPNYNF